MKHSIICPVSQLERFATRSNFHLILPHLFEQYPQYIEFYKERAKQGDHILIDNSVFELEHSFDYKKMIEYAEEMGAIEISAPEVLKDQYASLKLREEFLNYYVKTGSKVNILAVAQGKNFEEIQENYFDLLKIPEITALGLPFDIDEEVSDISVGIQSLTLRRVVNRWNLVFEITVRAWSEGITLKPTHLMGLSDPLELQRYKEPQYNWIRSNDSSSAFVHGINNIRFTPRGLPGEKIKQKLDFGGYSELSQDQIDNINFNIDTIFNWIK